MNEEVVTEEKSSKKQVVGGNIKCHKCGNTKLFHTTTSATVSIIYSWSSKKNEYNVNEWQNRIDRPETYYCSKCNTVIDNTLFDEYDNFDDDE